MLSEKSAIFRNPALSPALKFGYSDRLDDGGAGMIGAIRVLLTLAVLLIATPPARAGEPVDLLLVFAADVSRSIDEAQFKLQRHGYAAAILDKRVLEAVAAGPHRRIAVCFVEWSGAGAQKLLIDWMPVGDA